MFEQYSPLKKNINIFNLRMIDILLFLCPCLLIDFVFQKSYYILQTCFCTQMIIMMLLWFVA